MWTLNLKRLMQKGVSKMLGMPNQSAAFSTKVLDDFKTTRVIVFEGNIVFVKSIHVWI